VVASAMAVPLRARRVALAAARVNLWRVDFMVMGGGWVNLLLWQGNSE
jgi:hypothetical protein